MVSTGVVYLLAVLLVSTGWGLWLGLVAAVLSAAAFNFFHIPPTGGFTIADGENWVALVVFLVAAAVVSALTDAARTRAEEAERRRGEADLVAELARILLGGSELDIGQRTAHHLSAGDDRPSSHARSVPPVDTSAGALSMPCPECFLSRGRDSPRGSSLTAASDDRHASSAGLSARSPCPPKRA